jgi:hypothetical protein
MPIDPLTRKVTARGDINAPSAIPIEDFHGAAREGVTKMAGMKMAFMPYSGGECAPQHRTSVVSWSFTQTADRANPPPTGLAVFLTRSLGCYERPQLRRS